MVRLSLIVIARAIYLASSSSGLSFEVQGDLLSMNDDGSLKWRWAPTEWLMDQYKEGADGTFYVKARGTLCPHCYDGLLCALDGADGSVKWQLPYLGKDYFLATVGDIVGIIDGAVYMTHGSDVDAIDDTGVVKGTWQNVGGMADVGPEGSVLAYYYYKPGESGVSLLAQDTGKVKWSFTHEDLNSWAMSEDGIFATVVNPAFDQADLIYLDGHDGSVTWNVSLPVWQNMTDRFSMNNKLRPVLGSNGEVYLNGVEKDGVCSVIAFDASGNILRSKPCFELKDWDLHVTHPKEDGTLEDVFIYSDVQHYSDPVIHDPSALLGSSITAYSGTTGNLLWNVSFPGEDFRLLGMWDKRQDGSLTVEPRQDGTIFARRTDLCTGWDDPCDQFVAIRNGVEAWRVNATNILLAKNGVSYFSKVNRHTSSIFAIVAVDEDGSQMWSYDPQLVAPTVPAMALV